MRPILGSNVQPHGLRKTAFPIAQSVQPAVRASKTFRRLAASETLNGFGQAAIGVKSAKAAVDVVSLQCSGRSFADLR